MVPTYDIDHGGLAGKPSANPWPSWRVLLYSFSSVLVSIVKWSCLQTRALLRLRKECVNFKLQ